MIKLILCFILNLCLIFTVTSCERIDDGRFYALDFDGVDDTVIVLNPGAQLNNLSTAMTIESWIFPRSFPNPFPRIIDRSDNIARPPSGDRFLLSIQEPDATVGLNINGYVVSSAQISLNQWTHIAGTYDGVTMRIYLNGELSGSKEVSTTINVTNSLLYIGSNSRKNRLYDGYINEVRIWNIVLDSQKIKDNMPRKLAGTEPGLIAYWKFNEGTGQIVKDGAGNSDGQLGWQSGSDERDPKWIKAK